MDIDRKLEQTMEDEDDIIDLGMLVHDFFRGLKKFRWVIAILAVGMSVAVLAVSVLLYRPLYESKASFTVATSTSSAGNYEYEFDYSQSAAEKMAKTFPYILESDLLTSLVKQDLGVEEIEGDISASAVSNSNLFTFKVTSEDPEMALAILESVIRNYPEVSGYVIGNTRLNMIEEPKLADSPCNEFSYLKRGVKGFLLGLAISFCFVFVYALTRKTIRKEEEIQDILNVPGLGAVPQVVFKKRSSQTKQELTILDERIGDYFREPLRSMALRLEQQMSEKSMNVLMVTSTMPQEGVTTVAQNLACALAEMDKKVLLLHSGFYRQLKDLADGKYRGKNAFTCDTVTGIWYCEADMKNGTEILRGADIKKSGSSSVQNREGDFNTVSLSGCMKELMEPVRREFDFVVIDAAPCSHMSEASLAAECSDLIVYVIKQDYVKNSRITDGLENICSYGASLAGCVLNQVQLGTLSGYGYGGNYRGYGGYGYGSYGNYGYGKRYGNYGSTTESRNIKFTGVSSGVKKRGEEK